MSGQSIYCQGCMRETPHIKARAGVIMCIVCRRERIWNTTGWNGQGVTLNSPMMPSSRSMPVTLSKTRGQAPSISGRSGPQNPDVVVVDSVYDQLGRSVWGCSARRADTYVLVTNIQ